MMWLGYAGIVVFVVSVLIFLTKLLVSLFSRTRDTKLTSGSKKKVPKGSLYVALAALALFLTAAIIDTNRLIIDESETSSSPTLTNELSAQSNEPESTSTGSGAYDVTLTFPVEKYPETAAHIQKAIESGESPVCTIDRGGADDNRDESLKGIPTKDGHDRDEWPMAMCAEGGEGADIAYVPSSDNRGSGSWVGNALEQYEDGKRVLFVIDSGLETSEVQTVTADSSDVVKISESSPTPEPTPEPSMEPTPEPEEVVYYANCTAVRNAGAGPIRRGDPGYSSKLDRDGDGIGCE